MLPANSLESNKEADQLRAKLADALSKNQQLERYNQLLSEQLRLLLLDKYGASSERLSDNQLALLELEPSVCRAEVLTEAALEEKAKALDAPQAEKAPEKEPAQKPVRGPLPAHLPREERIVACAEDQCHCGQCGGRKKLIGYETSERVSIRPVEFFIEVTKREKLACAKCEELGVSVAEVPPSIIEKGILSDALLVDVIIKKYLDHQPLYRQAAGMKRDAGIEMSQATLSASALKAGVLLKEVCQEMKADLLAGGYIQADETTVPVQSARTKGKNHQAYLWEYGRPQGAVVYDFRMGREREGPEKFLAGYNGRLQIDGYAGYNKVGGADIVYFGCWAHARRKFFEASKVDPTDARSVALVVKIGELYAVEAQAREAQLDAAGREALRREKSAPLLNEIKLLIFEAKPRALPQSALGKACTYALNQWERLERYAQAGHGRVEIDNNWAENAMRGVALGRKNWIHIGSEEAGPKIAAILSVLETCKRLNIPVREYLEAVLPQLAYASTRPKVDCKAADLTPMAWARTRKSPPQ